MDRIVVVGGSIAGVTAARKLRDLGFAGAIRILDEDPAAPYRRPEVSKTFLTSPPGPSRLGLPEDLGVETVTASVLDVDLEHRVLMLPEGQVSYDGLVIASGSRARQVTAWAEVDGVHSLRTAADADRLRGDFATAEVVTVIGAGFIGLEVAAKAAALGKQVRVVEAAPVPLDRVADPAFGSHLRLAHERRGVEFRCGSSVTGVERSADTSQVHLADGETLHSDLVVSAVGSTPATDWLAGSGLDISAGVHCDETCAVIGVQDVVAAGDVASWVNPLFGTRMRVEHWTNAVEQGAYAAARLLGQHDAAGFVSVPYFWSNQADLKVECVGSTLSYDECRVLGSDGDRIVLAYGIDGVLTAVAGVGATAVVLKSKSLVAERAGIDDPRLADLAA